MLEQLREYRNKAIKDHPEYADDIHAFYTLAVSEIEDGESPQNEYELFVDSIRDLIEGEEEEKEEF